MISVLLVDDQDLVRMGLRALISGEEDTTVAGEAADGIAAVAEARRLRPDVVLMDIRMPGIDGIEATRRIVGAGLTARVLVLTTFHNDEYVWGALRAGASGFMLKRSSPERLIDAVEVVAAGDALLDPTVTRDLVRHFIASGPAAGPVETSARLAELTERETQVLRLVAEGYSNGEIADVLFIAESTAKTHVKRILAKVGARDRAQAVVIAFRGGLMMP
jgi:DNA-binding NarL/FixJ family response regulator